MDKKIWLFCRLWSLMDSYLTCSHSLRVLLATLIFCLISGLTYTLNDLLDIKADRLHPQKKNRPIASGRLSVQHAILLSVILALIAFPQHFTLH
jgi:4-hydroxybenzoate polyprenyltransferase